MLPDCVQEQQHRKRLGLSLLVSAAIVGLFVLFAPIRFETNDDVAMMLIASGAYTGSPDQHLVFIHVAIGYILKFLYQHFQGVEFYPLLLITAHVYASTVILAFLMQLRINRTTRVLILLLLLLFEFSAIIRLQFTITSGLLATAAVIQTLRISHWPKWMGLLTFILAACLRFEAAMLVLILSAPILIHEERYRQGIKYLMIFICTGVTLKTADSFYYNMQAEWREYRAYDNARGKINDNPNEHRFSPRSAQEKNDYQLLLNFLPNPAGIGTERLQEIAEELRNIPWHEKIVNVKKTLKLLGIPLLMIFLAFAALSIHLRVNQRWVIASVLLLYAALVIYISLNSTFKPRVFSISVAPLFFIYLPIFAQDVTRRWSLIISYATIFAFVLGLCYANLKEIRSYPLRFDIISEQTRLIDAYRIDRQKAVFGSALKIEYINPFGLSKYFAERSLVLGGWLTKTPFSNQPASYADLLNKGLLIAKSDTGAITQMMIQSFKDNHSMDVAYKRVQTSENFVILEFFQQ